LSSTIPDVFKDFDIPAELCLACKAVKKLCGKPRCPILIKAEAIYKAKPFISATEISGSSPPGVFIGNLGYPKVSVGPLVPPITGSTEIFDSPEGWLGKSFDEIVGYRYKLIRGRSRLEVHEAKDPGKLLSSLQEIAMSPRHIDAEMVLERRPDQRLVLSDESQPFGPSAPLKQFKPSSMTADKRIEHAYYDKDLTASEAVFVLFRRGVEVSRLQKAFSLGMFGTSTKRKIVPTRWSITAVDSNVSLQLIEKIKQYNTIDKFRVYSFANLDNRFSVILAPELWRYEMLEAWFPNTTWNINERQPALEGDSETYFGRTTYAKIHGSYYAARLGIAEYLDFIRRQASTLVLREIHPGYILPVGVWNIREAVRAAMKQKYFECETFSQALQAALSKLTLKVNVWMEKSEIIREWTQQSRLKDYF
jgi:hypothetical protein